MPFHINYETYFLGTDILDLIYEPDGQMLHGLSKSVSVPHVKGTHFRSPLHQHSEKKVVARSQLHVKPSCIRVTRRFTQHGAWAEIPPSPRGGGGGGGVSPTIWKLGDKYQMSPSPQFGVV